MTSLGRKEGEGLVGHGPLWKSVWSQQLYAQSSTYFEETEEKHTHELVWEIEISEEQVNISHCSSGPLLHSGALQERRTEVGVSE